MRKLTERVQMDLVLYQETLDLDRETGPVTEWVSLEAHRGVCFVVVAGELGQAEFCQVFGKQAKDANGTDPQGAGSAQIGPLESGVSGMVTLQVLAEDLHAGYTHVALNLAGPATAKATVLALRHDGRYLPPT